MGAKAELDPRPGGIYRVSISDQIIARGEYVEVSAPNRVVFTFGWEGEGAPIPPGSSTVEVTLAPDGDGTIVRLRHAGLPADQQASHDDGWSHFIPRLVAAAEGRDPGPDSMGQPG